MTIRLKGKLIQFQDREHQWQEVEHCTVGGHDFRQGEIELPHLSRKPIEGDAILLKAEVLEINEGKDFYEVFVKCKTFADNPYFKLDNIVAILPKEAKKLSDAEIHYAESLQQYNPKEEKKCECLHSIYPPTGEREYIYRDDCPIHGRKVEEKMEWCEIELPNGNRTFVDKDDYEFLNRFNWHESSEGYAVRNANLGHKTKQISMARIILGMVDEDERQVDHINGNQLDNRKVNLRYATVQENNMNRKKYRGHQFTSKYKGVSWDTNQNKWRARLKKDNDDIHIGRYDSEEEAAKAYDKKATEVFGEFASLNFSKRPDASTKAKVELPEKFEPMGDDLHRTKLATKINQLIDYLKWKESHDQDL